MGIGDNSSVIASAKGTRRSCALPNSEYFCRRREDQRNFRNAYAYAEYVAACDKAGERPYTVVSGKLV